MRVSIAAALVAALLWSPAVAAPVIVKQPVVVSAPEPDYPPLARAGGEQGEVKLSGIVGTDGAIKDVVVESSSRSALLDESAVEAFSRWTFQPAVDDAGKPVEARVVTTLEFWKDTIQTLGEKTCADFVADFDWRRSAFPESDKPMRLALLTQGMGLFYSGKHQREMDALRKDFPGAWARTYAQCRDHPEKRFLAVLLNLRS